MERPKRRKKPPVISVLRQYQENVDKVRLLGVESQLPETEVNALMDQYMMSLIAKQDKMKRGNEITERNHLSCLQKVILFIRRILVISISLLAAIMILYIVLQHKPIQYFFQSKLQDFIYPGMKILRKLALPVISLFPSLTQFYDESCLVVNPYFRVPDMPCPCEDVRAILKLTSEDIEREEYHPGIPFMLKLNREEISWEKLKALYKNHSAVFDRDASHLTISSTTSQGSRSTPASLFYSEWDIKDNRWTSAHVEWRCNRMEPTRLLRSFFGVPGSAPSYAAGVTIEKLVMIDGPRAPSYRMPTTEGTTVFILQSSGSRMIVLNPANECKDRCTSVSVEMPPGHILWFSWWYWRASSLPSPTTSSISITYVGSYL